MRKTLKNSLLVTLALLLVSCESADSPTERFRLPPAAFNVWFLVNEAGGIKQLSYSVPASSEGMAGVKQLEAELASSGFIRCDSGDDWFGLANQSGRANSVKRHTRFYRGRDKYRLAALSVDQTCGDGGGKCTHETTLVFNVFPWWIFDREDTIKQICGISASQ